MGMRWIRFCELFKLYWRINMPNFNEGQNVTVSDGNDSFVYTITNTIGDPWSGISIDVGSMALTAEKLEAAYRKSAGYMYSTVDEAAHYKPELSPHPKRKDTQSYLEMMFGLNRSKLKSNETYYLLMRRDGFMKVQIGIAPTKVGFKQEWKSPLIPNSSFAALDDAIQNHTVAIETFRFTELTKEGYCIFEEV